MRPTEVFVAAGSNIEPVHHLQYALAAIRARFGAVRCSTVYRNTAVGFDGDDFYNLVLMFATTTAPRSVLRCLHDIEDHCGRDRALPRYSPRSLDLDMLLYGDLQIDEPGLHLPRGDITEQSFVLGPLAELEPDRLHPGTDLSYAELWDAFDQGSHPLIAVDIDIGAGN